MARFHILDRGEKHDRIVSSKLSEIGLSLLEFISILLHKLVVPCFLIFVVPGPQLRRWSEVFCPQIHIGVLLRHSPRPQPIDENTILRAASMIAVDSPISQFHALTIFPATSPRQVI